MRGKVPVFGALMLIGRITPAYAGKSVPDSVIVNFVKDHPRLCGEKPDWDGLDKTAQGSPPPMRGKEFLWIMPTPVFRITPAYAGKSSCAGPGECPVPDHPRLCGEKFGGGQDFYPAAGSMSLT